MPQSLLIEVSKGCGRSSVENDMKTRAVSTWHRIRRFAESEAGAVTVDWVVLTAAICGMIIALFTILTEGIYEETANAIGDRIRTASDVNN